MSACVRRPGSTAVAVSLALVALADAGAAPPVATAAPGSATSAPPVATAATTWAAGSADPVVKALFFYMPTCGHCKQVMDEVLPPISARFGAQLAIAFVDVSTPDGNDLFYAAGDKYAIPDETMGVPLMIVGGEALSGDVEIPARLAGVVEQGLAAGGLAWPDVAGVTELVAALAAATVPAEAGGAAGGPAAQRPAVSGTAPDLSHTARPSIRTTWGADPAGFGIALVVLVLMVASAARVGWGWLRYGLADGPTVAWQAWTVPLLCVAGVSVAAYLGYVETAHVTAVCGPVGDCNAVQNSAYARLFGILPVGLLGIAGYLVVLGLWAWRRYRRDAWWPGNSWAGRARWLLPLVLLLGVAFSIYLTMLELLVILAVCMWCVTSAVIMTLLLWAVYLGWAEAAAPIRSPAR